MKYLQMILIATIAIFAFSCSEENTVDPPVEEIGSVELIAADGTEITGNLMDNLVSFNTQVKNNSTRDLTLWALMEVVELAPNQKTYYCWGLGDEGTCYAERTTDLKSDRTITLTPGQITDPGSFACYLKNESAFGGTSKIRYIVYEDGNEDNRDTVLYTITF